MELLCFFFFFVFFSGNHVQSSSWTLIINPHWDDVHRTHLTQETLGIGAHLLANMEAQQIAVQGALLAVWV